jgi:hypothetical protein
MKKKKKKLISLVEKVRRDNEIKETGKLVSLRPSITHKSKKDYSRKWKLEDYE